MKRIIIIGGMGPQASLELHGRIIQRAIANGACDGADFPLIIHLSLPIDDFISDNTKLDKALKLISDSLSQLKPRQDDTVAIACNTAHLLIDRIEQLTGANIVSLINVTVHHIVTEKIQQVHIAATPTTLRTKLYEKPLMEFGINVTKPKRKELKEIERLIRETIAGHEPTFDRDLFASDAALLLGCTELSCVGSNAENVIDPLNILVNAIIAKAPQKSFEQ